MMMMGSETDGTIGRISYAEFYHVGQGNIVGRYPIHYHKCVIIILKYREMYRHHS
jgi:hypothetical protein